MEKSSAKGTFWITRTALGVALVIVAQLIGKMIPAIAVIFGPFSVSQLITGTLVNCILVTMTIQVGILSGVTVGILSSVLATLVGIGPIVPMITPLIAIGNAVLVVAFGLIVRRGMQKPVFLGAIVVAAVLKCAFLWTSVPMMLGLLPEIKPQQIAMLSIMFSWPQAITALCGGLLALAVYPALRSATNR